MGKFCAGSDQTVVLTGWVAEVILPLTNKREEYATGICPACLKELPAITKGTPEGRGRLLVHEATSVQLSFFEQRERP